MKLYQLVSECIGRQPARLQMHLRYALYGTGCEVTLPAGTWLLELPGVGNGSPNEHDVVYQLVDGSLVYLSRQLLEREAILVENPEAIRAMSAHRSLEQVALADWGVTLEHIDSQAPFRLIKCPLCWGTAFSSVDFAQVWCDGCNANFTVRHTAGDPGFVVDVTWQHYHGRSAHYLLPRTAHLCLTLVFKDSGDPLDLAHDQHCWRDDCTPDQAALTGPESALRPGLHACQVGTLYGWSLNGRVPGSLDLNRHSQATLVWPDGRRDLWPGTTSVRPNNLTHEERCRLEEVARELERQPATGYPGYKERLLGTVKELLDRPFSPPYVAYQVPFPDVGRLQKGEKYLLYRWLLKRQEARGLVYAYPDWLVVTAPDDVYDKWLVVRANLCPSCGREVQSGAVAQNQERRSHRWCNALWQELGWRPDGPMCK